jgi:diguanylate cyclase (GGDEF)-like protein
VLVAGGCLLLLAARLRYRRERARLRQAAFTDPLTGLANRRLLQAMAQHELARHRRDRAKLALLMLDLDGFKRINDRFGHDAGDQLLREVASALRAALRAQDTVARLGGDEFCVLAPQTADPQALSARVMAAISTVVAHRESLTASVGVALFPEDGSNLEALLEVADGRLLSAKQRRLAAGGRVGSSYSGAGTSRAA